MNEVSNVPALPVGEPQAEPSSHGLEACEDKIREGGAMICMGMFEIARDRHYLAEDLPSFNAYLKERGIPKSWAYKMVLAGSAIEKFHNSGNLDWMPSNASQAAPFARVQDDQLPLAAQVVWETAPRVDGEPRITAQHIENTLIDKRFIYPKRKAKTTQEKLDEQNLKKLIECYYEINLTPFDPDYAVSRFGKARFNRAEIIKAIKYLQGLADNL